LRSIARVTAGVVEAAGGTAARIGGEEFAVILPDAAAAREVAEGIRVSVERLALNHPLSTCGVQTVSLGVAVRVPAGGEDPIELMKLADQALYAAKLAGRNRVACG
jgi:diguanylate cyclase (GGDEF)-like protein